MNKKTVLVIDDSGFVREMVRKIVGMLGHDTIQAEDGVSGLELALEKRPELIVLDVKMPKMDGLTLLKTLRANPDFSDVPIIMLSSIGDQHIVTGAVKMQIGAYVLKNDPKELAKRLQEFLK